MEHNRRWLVYANESRCNHVKALSEIGYVSWNPHNRKFKVGDYVYMFLSLDRNVRFKTKVTAVNVPRTDQKYWITAPSNSLTCRLELITEYNGEHLNEEELKKHGFKGGGSIEQPMCGNKELLDYIEEVFSKQEEL
jgi:hypothetical protein